VSRRRSGQTHSATETGATLRLPHEHDESSDSQASDVRPIIKQAHDDLVSGKVDTDRNLPMQQAYERQKGDSTASKNTIKNTDKRKGDRT
jgi:hypothetical protein